MGNNAFPRFSHEDDHRQHKEQYSALHPRDKNQRNPITLFKLNLMALFELSSLSSFFFIIQVVSKVRIYLIHTFLIEREFNCCLRKVSGVRPTSNDRCVFAHLFIYQLLNYFMCCLCNTGWKKQSITWYFVMYNEQLSLSMRLCLHVCGFHCFCLCAVEKFRMNSDTILYDCRVVLSLCLLYTKVINVVIY